MKWLNKLERKFGNIYISNLMLYIVVGTLIVYIFAYLFPDLPILYYLGFDRDAIFSGQVWRVLTFILEPYCDSPVFMILSCYFYWMIGSELERAWGGFRFNLFYFVGVLGTIIGGLITGFASCHFLNLSLFLAYAAIFPDTRFMLFFIIPVKAKYIAYVDAAFLAIQFLLYIRIGLWPYSLVILIAFVNFFLFFGSIFFRKVRDHFKYRKVRKNFRSQIQMSRRDDDDE